MELIKILKNNNTLIVVVLLLQMLLFIGGFGLCTAMSQQNYTGPYRPLDGWCREGLLTLSMGGRKRGGGQLGMTDEGPHQGATGQLGEGERHVSLT